MMTKIRDFMMIVAALFVILWVVTGTRAQALVGEGAVQGERSASLATSSLLQYQGRLIDPSTGETMAEGFYTMTLSIYDVATGGSALWAEIKSVDVRGGLFNTVLGDTSPLDQSIFDGRELWLGVRVGVDPEAAPRQQFLPVAYALSLVPGATIDGDLTINGSLNGGTAWTSANDGAGSTLDADLLDGLNSTAFVSTTGPESISGSSISPILQVTQDGNGDGVWGRSTYTDTFGVIGESDWGNGVVGRITNPDNINSATVGWNQGGGRGVTGVSDRESGVFGRTLGDGAYSVAGVWGVSTYTDTIGVMGESDWGNGVMGRITNPDNISSATVGWNQGGGRGVTGISDNNFGVYGHTNVDSFFEHAGVYGHSIYTNTFGVLGESDQGIGVEGRNTNPENTRPAVFGYNTGGGMGVEGASTVSYGVYGTSSSTYGVATPDGMLAPVFYVGSPDVAEYFPAGDPDLEPGDVVVIGTSNGGFGLRRASRAFDTAVAGIVSTEPGITLGIKDGDIMPGDNEGEVPLALVGRVPCKVDASYGAIAVGDTLTTSPTPGYAMLCSDPLVCAGAIIGKALEPLKEGIGEILVLVTLQ